MIPGRAAALVQLSGNNWEWGVNALPSLRMVEKKGRKTSQRFWATEPYESLFCKKILCSNPQILHNPVPGLSPVVTVLRQHWASCCSPNPARKPQFGTCTVSSLSLVNLPKIRMACSLTLFRPLLCCSFNVL